MIAERRAGVVERGMQAAVRAYQLLVSPLLPPSCRFLPSCSDYAIEAIARHGALRGSGLALRRLPAAIPGAAAATIRSRRCPAAKPADRRHARATS